MTVLFIIASILDDIVFIKHFIPDGTKKFLKPIAINMSHLMVLIKIIIDKLNVSNDNRIFYISQEGVIDTFKP